MTAPWVCRHRSQGGLIIVTSPAVGLWRDRPALGSTLVAGSSIGEIEILGRRVEVRLPPEAYGATVGGRATDPVTALPVAYGDELLHLDPRATASDGISASEQTATSTGVGLVYRAPSSGRFWHRPSPDAEPFIESGKTLQAGDPVGLLEVMKTFTRLAYDAAQLPSPAVIVSVHAGDGDDVNQGDPLFEVEKA